MANEKNAPVADSLYLRLAEQAPSPREPGRTYETLAKETIDNDREGLSLAALEIG